MAFTSHLTERGEKNTPLLVKGEGTDDTSFNFSQTTKHVYAVIMSRP